MDLLESFRKDDLLRRQTCQAQNKLWQDPKHRQETQQNPLILVPLVLTPAIKPAVIGIKG